MKGQCAHAPSGCAAGETTTSARFVWLQSIIVLWKELCAKQASHWLRCSVWRNRVTRFMFKVEEETQPEQFCGVVCLFVCVYKIIMCFKWSVLAFHCCLSLAQFWRFCPMFFYHDHTHTPRSWFRWIFFFFFLDDKVAIFPFLFYREPAIFWTEPATQKKQAKTIFRKRHISAF